MQRTNQGRQCLQSMLVAMFWKVCAGYNCLLLVPVLAKCSLQFVWGLQSIGILHHPKTTKLNKIDLMATSHTQFICPITSPVQAICISVFHRQKNIRSFGDCGTLDVVKHRVTRRANDVPGQSPATSKRHGHFWCGSRIAQGNVLG